MKIKNQNNLKEKIIRKILGLVYRLDNSGSPIFEENGEANFINQLKDYIKTENSVIFDVGANIGEYSEVVANKFKGMNYSLHVFEPQKSCFSDLNLKFSENKNIYLNNFGLSDLDKTSVMYKNADKSVLTSLYKRNLDYYNLDMNVEEKIELKRADDYINLKNIKHIDLLKIDVEGHELSTLAGFGEYLNSDFISFIQFEYGGANLDSHTTLMDFYNILESKGFKVCKIMKTHLEYRKYNPRFENFVYQNYIAVSNTIFESLISK